jgi:hypothetical protein
MLLFRALQPSYTGQIHCRDGTRTTFQTVSEGEFSEVRIAPVQRSRARHGPYPATCLGPQSTEIRLPLTNGP